MGGKPVLFPADCHMEGRWLVDNNSWHLLIKEGVLGSYTISSFLQGFEGCCLSLLSIAMINTIIKNNLGTKGFIWLIHPDLSSILRETKAGTETVTMTELY